MRRIVALAALLTALAALAPSACAQIAGPLLDARAFEIGFAYHRVDRQVKRGSEVWQYRVGDGALACRYGLTPLATFSVELSADQDDFGFEHDASTRVVGAGLQTEIWTHEAIRLTTSLHYARTLWKWQDHEERDETQLIEWSLTGEYSRKLSGQDMAFWAGPAFSHYALDRVTSDAHLEWYPEQVIAVTAGLRALIARHLVLQGSFVWVGDVQSNVFFAYRF